MNLRTFMDFDRGLKPLLDLQTGRQPNDPPQEQVRVSTPMARQRAPSIYNPMDDIMNTVLANPIPRA